jgi:hypothetical protein
MKRDWDLIRNLLLKIEERTPEKSLSASDFQGDTNTISYHLTLLLESGLVVGHSVGTFANQFDCQIQRLSWNGHDFLDAISNDSSWNKIKDSVKKIGGKIAFETLKGIAIMHMNALIS